MDFAAAAYFNKKKDFFRVNKREKEKGDMNALIHGCLDS